MRDSDQNLAASLPELGLLFQCRSHPNPQDTADFRVRVLQNGNLERTLTLAERHGLSSLLYWNLQSHCPEAIGGKSLEDRFKRNAVRNLTHMQGLLRILQCFGEASIPAIPYKGPVLAVSVYKNLALREFFDLDILVDVPDVARASELLIASGYKCQTQFTQGQMHAYLSSGCELCFEGNGVAVELHWRIAPRAYSLPFSFPELWARRQTLSFGEQSIAMLSPEDTLLVLCAHAMKHSWNSLCWVMDVAELVRAEPQLDWSSAMQRARKMGAQRVLLLGLLLAHDLLSTPLPESVRVALRADGSLPRLVAHVLTKLQAPNPGTEFSFADHLFFLRSRERVIDKARYIMRVLFTPDLADWASEKPRFWAPLYRFTRLARITRKFVPLVRSARRRVTPLESAK